MTKQVSEDVVISGKFLGDKVHPVTGEVLYSREQHAMKMFGRNMTVNGAEIPDPVPAKPTVKTEKRMSMFDHMRNMVQAELRRREMEDQEESPEEASDLGDDDEDLIEHLSEYEQRDLEVTYARVQKELERRAAAAGQPKSAEGGSGAPDAGAAEGGQGAKPAEGGAPGASLTAEGAPAKA